jgi:hypothetical protein
VHNVVSWGAKASQVTVTSPAGATSVPAGGEREEGSILPGRRQPTCAESDPAGLLLLDRLEVIRALNHPPYSLTLWHVGGHFINVDVAEAGRIALTKS